MSTKNIKNDTKKNKSITKTKKDKNVSSKKPKYNITIEKQEKELMDNFKEVNNLFYSSHKRFKSKNRKESKIGKMNERIAKSIIIINSIALVFLLFIGSNGKAVETPLFSLILILIALSFAGIAFIFYYSQSGYFTKLEYYYYKLRKKAYNLIRQKIVENNDKVIDIKELENSKISNLKKLQKLNDIEEELHGLVEIKPDSDELFYVEDKKVYIISRDKLEYILKEKFSFKTTKYTIKDIIDNYTNHLKLETVIQDLGKEKIKIIKNMIEKGEETSTLDRITKKISKKIVGNDINKFEKSREERMI